MAAIELRTAKEEGPLREAYTYDHLPRGNQFRFLVLLPGVGDEPLECTLHTAIPADTEFEAISYVWGTTVRDQEVICDGRTMLVTPNLAQVLRRVRLPDRPRQLWADSICIDQDDAEEKGHQVALFGTIYRSAQRVLVYVGPDADNHGPAACSFIKDVAGMIMETFEKTEKDWDSFPYPDRNDPLLKDSRWDSFRALLTQDWFKRGWVVQEVVLSRQSQVIWGQSTLDWDNIVRTYMWAEKRAPSIYYDKQLNIVQSSDHYYMRLEDFAVAFFPQVDWRVWGSPSILRTLDDAKFLQVGDPRDRIYAFTELPQAPGPRFRPWPDYEESYLEIYRKFATEYVQTTKDTKILDYVCHGDKINNTTKEIPSWVPRWDIAEKSLMRDFARSLMLKSRDEELFEPQIEDDGSLKTRGVIFDSLRYVSDYRDLATPISEAVRKMWNDIVASGAPCPYARGSDGQATQLRAFLDALDGGSFLGEYNQFIRDRTAFAESAGLNDSSRANARSPTSGNEFNHFLAGISETLNARRFILTERGYMGLAPAAVREGDVCGIIFGCLMPCILRKKESKERYTFLGATTLLGKQWSEIEQGADGFCSVLGEEDSKDWVDWDVEEQDIHLC
ncbi:heterokaryon incompatibility protein-domain-containing protein [Paraphoma chrysanthemicola]|uniref:Heterokaryon incompatibility protein-domain-containing protein n=1 Tax=Paraphoma chrysanthemicola TaxID=798071 RepID=A0A8K0RH36_9PLEO|nr:heterokaryon incompatibility protein-domain-containing protein [Paraphoma chrysanthemicola]